MSSFRSATQTNCDLVSEQPAADFAALTDQELQLTLEAAVRAYAARAENGANFQPFSNPRALSATEVMIVVSRMLKSTGVEVFELGMWQAWTGGR